MVHILAVEEQFLLHLRPGAQEKKEENKRKGRKKKKVRGGKSSLLLLRRPAPRFAFFLALPSYSMRGGEKKKGKERGRNKKEGIGVEPISIKSNYTSWVLLRSREVYIICNLYL